MSIKVDITFCILLIIYFISLTSSQYILSPIENGHDDYFRSVYNPKRRYQLHEDNTGLSNDGLKILPSLFMRMMELNKKNDDPRVFKTLFHGARG